MSARIIHRVTGVDSTVGNQSKILCSASIPNGASAFYTITVSGRDTTNGDTVTIQKSGGAKQIAGVSSIVGALAQLLSVADAALATAAATVVASGGQVDLQITGVLTKTIEWFGHLEIHIN